jgi:hypothetical protein
MAENNWGLKKALFEAQKMLEAEADPVVHALILESWQKQFDQELIKIISNSLNTKNSSSFTVNLRKKLRYSLEHKLPRRFDVSNFDLQKCSKLFDTNLQKLSRELAQEIQKIGSDVTEHTIVNLVKSYSKQLQELTPPCSTQRELLRGAVLHATWVYGRPTSEKELPQAVVLAL